MKKLIITALILLALPVNAMTTKLNEKHAIYTAPQILTTSTSNVTESFVLGPFQSASFQCAWASVTGTAPQYKLQLSNDNSNWDDLAGAVTITSGTSGSDMLIIDPIPAKLARVNVSTASTTGTLDCVAVAQGR